MEYDPDHFALRRLGWIVLFGITMGMLEAIVVVYLRELYFPDGFRFPLQSMPQRMVALEVLREACTIVMLTAVAAVNARTFLLRFSVFCITFGVWDIFYYVFLKVLLNWPDSLLTWDVLFLIPVTWLGPVLAPLICSVIMIGFSLLSIYLHRIYGTVRSGWTAWLLLAAGALAVLSSFIADAISILARQEHGKDSAAFSSAMAAHVPANFHWTIFLAGEILIAASAAVIYRKTIVRR